MARGSNVPKFSAQGMFDNLKSCMEPSLKLTGMVRRAEGRDGVVQFAHGLDRGAWTDIGEAQIASYVFHSPVMFPDESLPLVTLVMKHPGEGEGGTFANLLKASPLNRSAVMPADTRTPVAASPFPGPGDSNCRFVIGVGWVCDS